jgi:Flp pilus assembly protein TadG
MVLRPLRRRRDGSAAVELAFVAPILMTVLFGLWEIGRMIQLQQVLSNAAREGARVAAQGLTINRTSSPTQIHVSTGDPNVKTTVVNYLKQAGLSLADSDVTVSFTYLTGDTGKTEPYQASKGQQFQVTVSVPMASLRWTPFAAPFTPDTMTAVVVWTSLVDDPFTLDTTLPDW